MAYIKKTQRVLTKKHTCSLNTEHIVPVIARVFCTEQVNTQVHESSGDSVSRVVYPASVHTHSVKLYRAVVRIDEGTRKITAR